MKLSFQNLKVYQRAIEFLALAFEIVEALPPGHSREADQLLRAAESVVRNIAEGAGRTGAADAKRVYGIARGEAMEAASSLDVLDVKHLVAKARYDRGIDLLVEVVSMLTGMC